MKNKFLLTMFSCLIIIIFSPFGYAASKYEPPDGRVIHGLGQYIPYYYTDVENWEYVSEYQAAVGHVPVIYSVYTMIDPDSASMDTTDFNQIVNNHGHPYLLNIGIALQNAQAWLSGSISIPVTTILNGDWDNRIRTLAQQVKALKAPTYIRPGFEFGIGNSGAHSDPNITPIQFKAIWTHIYNIFQNEDVTNIAWVWDTVNPWMFNYMDWYPGDEYVDWWGINYFTSEQISLSDPFLNSATAHQKPVMICESSPIHNGGATNAANWNQWYSPYFAKIRSFKNIKAFIYISNPWDKQGWWEDWADSRINTSSTNTTIMTNYVLEMDKSIHIHMVEYLNDPSVIFSSNDGGTGNDDNNLPVANDDISSTDEDTAVTINVLINDTDMDGDALSVASVTDPMNGSVANTGTDVRYNPNANFNGIDSFTYTVNDSHGGTDSASVTVNVGAENDGGDNDKQDENGEKGNGGGCFIFTAAYGSPMENHVKLMREFRDRFLVTSSIGRVVVHFYYSYSPPIANFISNKEGLRVLVRYTLQPVVYFSWTALHLGIFYAFTFIIFLCLSIVVSSFLLYKKIRFKEKKSFLQND
jgi:hypothetical protein